MLNRELYSKEIKVKEYLRIKVNELNLKEILAKTHIIRLAALY